MGQVTELNLDSRWFPPVRITASSDVNLSLAVDEFMLKSTGSDDSVVSDHQIPTYQWDVFRTGARSGSSVAPLQMPRLKRLYHSANPGQSYDFGVVRFSTMAGSRLWLSDAAISSTNYFLNMTRLSIVHSAATVGSAALHSALIDVGGVGVLMPGAAFSGKSSLAVFGMLAGAKLISDDLVLVGRDSENHPIGRTFRRTILMRERTHRLLPEDLQKCATAASIGGITKYSYSRSELEGCVGVNVPVRHILFPSVSHEPLRNAPRGYSLENLDKAGALRQVLGSLDTSVVMKGLNAERARVMSRLAALVAQCSCQMLCMDSRFLDDPAENCAHLLDRIL